MTWRIAGVFLVLWSFGLQLAQPQSLLRKASVLAERRTNPYAGDENARRAGKKLFLRECSGCHGDAGRGNGRWRTPLLATPMVRQADPGALFWILRNGSASHRMPSFSHLPEQQRWQIITYLQSLH
jgi:mono/diheme cytochrome c family protein